MQVWAKSLKGIPHFMEVQPNCSLKIQIWDIRPTKRTPYKVEFQVILKEGTFLKVEWAAKKDHEEHLLLQLIVNQIAQRKFRNEPRRELLCSINLSPFWIQFQKTMRTIWQLTFHSKNKEMGPLTNFLLIIHIKSDQALITWKLMMNLRFIYLHDQNLESFKTKFINFIQILKKLIFRI